MIAVFIAFTMSVSCHYDVGWAWHACAQKGISSISHHPWWLFIYNHVGTTRDTIISSPRKRERVCFFDFISWPAHILQGEEQVPVPIRTEGMFLSDHQDVYSLFGECCTDHDGICRLSTNTEASVCRIPRAAPLVLSIPQRAELAT